MEKLLTTQEVADYLGLTRRTIYTFVQEGTLRAVKVGREWRIKESELEAFINRGSGEIKEKEAGT
jgi:excisionase family DNA binding protein